MKRGTPAAGREFKDYHSYVPFDSVVVVERERPLLYDPSGKPIIRVRKVGFDPVRVIK